jgi:hypothetical protein
MSTLQLVWAEMLRRGGQGCWIQQCSGIQPCSTANAVLVYLKLASQ